MPDRDGIFAGDDPFALTKDWLAEATKTEPNDPNAISLATVNADGQPNVRVVLLKDILDDAFVFYTNYGSQKAQELEAAGQAAFVLHWKSLRRQIRVRGAIAKEDGALADEYFASRSVKSRLGAWASQQSQPLADRATLENAVRDATLEQGSDPKRPPNWGGYRLTPHEIEFWADGANRLHDRFLWRRDAPGQDWSIQRLFP